jgi:hypothetical protein
VNGLVWVRPPEAEYDAWEALGNSGWNWDSMYAAMKKVCLLLIIMAECEVELIVSVGALERANSCSPGGIRILCSAVVAWLGRSDKCLVSSIYSNTAPKVHQGLH